MTQRGDAGGAGVGGLVWDRGNVRHLTRDKGRGRRPVTVAEVDDLYAGGRYAVVERDHWRADGTYELQWLLIGRSPGDRLLAVACQLVDHAGAPAYRPVTAWDAEGDQIAAYREEFPDD